MIKLMKKLLPFLPVLFFLIALPLFGWFLYTHQLALFTPKGIIASKERDFIILAVLLMFVVMIPMLITGYFFAWRYREGNHKAKHNPEGEKLVGGLLWAIIPAVVVVSLISIVWIGAHELDPFKAIDNPGVKPLTVQVIALDWKWLFVYPEQGIATVNYLEIPEKTPINFQLTADEAPMSSFWIPQLGGQMYAMAGMSTQLHLMADGVGEYSGQSAEINGKGFAGMKFVTKSVSGSEFSDWVKRVKTGYPALTLDRYNQLILPSEYNPVSYYSLAPSGLYNEIINKYMRPSVNGFSMGEMH